MTDAKTRAGHEEELVECKLIVLKIVRYMKDNHLTQKDLAKRLNVTPQYINKFLHGQDLDMKVSTILRYGKLLGINLITVPSDDALVSVLSYGSLEIKKGDIQPSVFAYNNNFLFIPTMHNKATCHFGKAESVFN